MGEEVSVCVCVCLLVSTLKKNGGGGRKIGTRNTVYGVQHILLHAPLETNLFSLALQLRL